MPKNLEKLTGVEPVRANTALIVLDMISDFDFEDGDRLFENAARSAENLSGLIDRARREDVPVIYVNDNFGKWKEDFAAFVRSLSESTTMGQKIIEMVGPRTGDYHILKPQRSAFFATPLEVLLLTLSVSDIIMTGVTTDICVLFSAHDAYMRGYKLKVPADGSAAVENSFHQDAVRLMQRVVYADTSACENVEFS